MFITRNNTRYELDVNEMLAAFCTYELKCDMAYAEELSYTEEFFKNNSEIANKLIYREIALDMRSHIEQGEYSKLEALQIAKKAYIERASESGLSLVDFLKNELCREVGCRIGAYKHVKGEYVLEDGHTRVTFTNPNALLDCYLQEMSVRDPNNPFWNWAMQFLDENR